MLIAHCALRCESRCSLHMLAMPYVSVVRGVVRVAAVALPCVAEGGGLRVDYVLVLALVTALWIHHALN